MRTEEQDVKRRLNTLFGKEEEEVEQRRPDAVKKAKDEFGDDTKAEEAYQTVEEGMTTDTTEAPS